MPRSVKKVVRSSPEKKVVADKVATPSPSPKISDRSKHLSSIVGKIEGFKLWSNVEPPLVLPTRVTSLNRGLKCGGIPGGMLGVLHGPSQGGKSLLLAELEHAAWASGGWGLFVDAECRAVDLKWYDIVCGNLDEVVYYKPKTFEDTIDRIQKFRKAFRTAKEEGKVPPAGFLLIGIDSINRLTPESELAMLMAKDAKSSSKDGRKYPIRALMTSSWLDTIVPTLERDESLVFITRESIRMDAQPGQKTYRVKGGTAAIYDGGWICRVTSASKVKKEDGDSKVVIGEKHEIEFVKNSMGPHLEEVGFFYSAIGRGGDPAGFDFIREVREEAILRGLLKYESGRGYFYESEIVAKSKDMLVPWLKSESEPGREWHEVIRERLNATVAKSF